jgi:hypothetical protein
MKLVIIKPKSTSTTSHNFFMLATALVVATALLLGTVVMMIGVNQQAEAIAISEKGVKIDVSEDGDAKLDVSVEEGKRPCRTCLA